MFLFVEVLASLVENFWAVYIPGRLAGKRTVRWRHGCMAVIFLTVCVSVINRYILFSVLTSVVGVLMMALTAGILYRVNFGEALFIATAYFVAIYMFDFLVLALLGTVSGNPDYAGMVADEYSGLRMWFLIISKLFLCCACGLFLYLHGPGIGHTGTQENPAGIFGASENMLPVGRRAFTETYSGRFGLQKFDRWSWLLLGIMVLYYLVNDTLLQSDMGALISWLLFLALIVLGTYGVLQHFINRAQKEHMALEMELVRMKTENYERFMEDYRRNQIFYHDLKNHYLVLKAHLANREYERAEAYMDNLVLPLGGEPAGRLTGIESLDILIAYKKNQAERKGIRVSIAAEPVMLRLTEAESVALLGNLLDNAIEAYDIEGTEKTGITSKDVGDIRNMGDGKDVGGGRDAGDTGEKQISITIRQIRGMQFIKITNLCQAGPCRENGREGGKENHKENHMFRTKKADKSIHGIGLRSAAAITEKYGGILRTEYIEGQFSVIISFFDSREQ